MGRDPIDKSEFGNTPVLAAIAAGQKELAQEYIGEADSALLNTPDKRADCKNTPLILTIKMGWEDVALDLLEKKVDVHALAADGFSALHYACLLGQDNVIKELVKRGAFVSQKNDFGATPLDYYGYQFSDLDLLMPQRKQGSTIFYQYGGLRLKDINHAIHHAGFPPRKKIINPQIQKLLGDSKQMGAAFKDRVIGTRIDALKLLIDAIGERGPRTGLETAIQKELDECFWEKMSQYPSYPVVYQLEEAREEIMQRVIPEYKEFIAQKSKQNDAPVPNKNSLPARSPPSPDGCTIS